MYYIALVSMYLYTYGRLSSISLYRNRSADLDIFVFMYIKKNPFFDYLPR